MNIVITIITIIIITILILIMIILYIYACVYPIGGLEHFSFSHILLHIGNFIIPTDELIFFRGVGQPPTRYMYVYIYMCVYTLWGYDAGLVE